MTFPSDRTSTRAAASGPEAHPRPRPLTADLLERLQGVRDALPVESVMVRRHADDPGIEVLAGRRLFTEAERLALPFDSAEYSYSVVCAAVAVEPAPRLPLVGVGLGRIAADAVAALKARSAALLGDDEQVDRFAADVLGLRSGGRWREAVSTALLGDWPAPLFSGDPIGPCALAGLRKEAATRHAQLTPLWRRRVRNARLLSLDAPLADGLSLAGLVTGGRSAEDSVIAREPDDPRLAALLRSLGPAERAVVEAWGDGAVGTWTEAAIRAGEADPCATGERVRRKVRRWTAEQERRGALRR
nr:hypothetical protein [Streptomyces sp. DSM 41633]